MVRLGIKLSGYAAMDDDLRLSVGAGFEQDRIEIAMRLQASGQRLQCLSAANFSTIHGHCRVECHVLRLERRHAHPTTM